MEIDVMLFVLVVEMYSSIYYSYFSFERQLQVFALQHSMCILLEANPSIS